jgi:hypothetical protein
MSPLPTLWEGRNFLDFSVAVPGHGGVVLNPFNAIGDSRYVWRDRRKQADGGTEHYLSPQSPYGDFNRVVHCRMRDVMEDNHICTLYGIATQLSMN